MILHPYDQPAFKCLPLLHNKTNNIKQKKMQRIAHDYRSASGHSFICIYFGGTEETMQAEMLTERTKAGRLPVKVATCYFPISSFIPRRCCLYIQHSTLSLESGPQLTLCERMASMTHCSRGLAKSVPVERLQMYTLTPTPTIGNERKRKNQVNAQGIACLLLLRLLAPSSLLRCPSSPTVATITTEDLSEDWSLQKKNHLPLLPLPTLCLLVFPILFFSLIFFFALSFFLFLFFFTPSVCTLHAERSKSIRLLFSPPKK
ncbi:hypothetical protein QOT17_001878 [Balamuthia mandrillaris]